jgi:hypothetical protein
MGTRNLTVAIYNNQVKIAQYGQWDGYPSGQGNTILEFLKKLPDVKQEFLTNLSLCKFTEDGEGEAWSRNTGAKILHLILEKPLELFNDYKFAADSLFCEFCYVLDFDNEVLEFYKGFNTKPIPENNRFYSLVFDRQRTVKYYPVKLLEKYHFSKLPSVEDMKKLVEIEDEIRESEMYPEQRQ